MKLQVQTLTVTDLINKGYTVGAAARAINRSKTHVYYVITGRRISRSVIDELTRLPSRAYIARERITR